jgi:hypothetical protein
MEVVMKKIIEFELNGQPVYFETEMTEVEGMRRVSRGGDVEETEKATSRFTDAVSCIKPAAEVVFNAFREINTPDEIGIEFGIKFNAKAGVVFVSTDSEATFKVSLMWKSTK